MGGSTVPCPTGVERLGEQCLLESRLNERECRTRNQTRELRLELEMEVADCWGILYIGLAPGSVCLHCTGWS